jgi:ABC-type multidrug transport system ATPase subunit
MKVECRALAKRYGKVRALAGLDLAIAPGERVALVGPNGSGKSTLLRAILGLVRCEGEVLLDGRPPLADGGAALRQVAYAPQVAPQLWATVGELVGTVLAVRDAAPEPVREVAAALGLDLPALSHRPFRELSGGMRQKLLLAVALGLRPSLLVLDEPTASLDPRARDVLLERLADPGEATLICCSHRADDLRSLVDRVVTLEEGRIVSDGPLAAVLPRPVLRPVPWRGGDS